MQTPWKCQAARRLQCGLMGIILLGMLGVLAAVSAPRFSAQSAHSPTVSHPQQAVPWGAFYMPVDVAIANGMTGTITGKDLDRVGEILAQARAGHVKVIVTLGTVDECAYYASATVFNYEKALRDKTRDLRILIYRVGGYAALESYVNDGTLAAIRLFDEVHYAGHCGDDRGIPYQLSWCDGGRVLNGLPVGTDAAPGFADLLHELKKMLPDTLPIGSTSQPSYMGHVAARLNTLREREHLPPLATNSILAYSGYNRDRDYPGQTARQKIECFAGGFPNADLIFYLGELSCNNNPDNFTWWSDYLDGCQAQNIDFFASWSWDSGAAGNFETRLQDLLDGGVSSGDITITLGTVQAACSGAGP